MLKQSEIILASVLVQENIMIKVTRIIGCYWINLISKIVVLPPLFSHLHVRFYQSQTTL